ncbi:MAG TPA: hypothetical protein VGF61_07215 [Candidatus Acidoferrum sp.]
MKVESFIGRMLWISMWRRFKSGGEPPHSKSARLRRRPLQGLGERADFFEDGGGGIGVEDIDALDATAGGFDFFAANDLIAGPVATLDENIGEKSRDDGARSGFVEDEDGIDAFETGEDFGALVLRNNRAAGSFEGANAVIAIDADDEEIAEGAGGFEAANVSGMEKIEAAIGEDNFAAVAFLGSKPQNRLFQS